MISALHKITDGLFTYIQNFLRQPLSVGRLPNSSSTRRYFNQKWNRIRRHSRPGGRTINPRPQSNPIGDDFTLIENSKQVGNWASRTTLKEKGYCVGQQWIVVHGQSSIGWTTHTYTKSGPRGGNKRPVEDKKTKTLILRSPQSYHKIMRKRRSVWCFLTFTSACHKHRLNWSTTGGPLGENRHTPKWGEKKVRLWEVASRWVDNTWVNQTGVKKSKKKIEGHQREQIIKKRDTEEEEEEEEEDETT